MIGKHPLSNKDYPSMINTRHYQRIMDLMKHEKIVEGGYGDMRLKKIAPTILVNVKDQLTFCFFIYQNIIWCNTCLPTV